MLTITKVFRFEASHWLPGHPKCGALHGHSYKLEVEVSGPVGTGMIMDFSDLREIVQERILDHVDHKCLNVWLNAGSEVHIEYVPAGRSESVTIQVLSDSTPIDPTAENIVARIRNILAPVLEGRQVHLASLRLWETETSCAQWKCP
jgi:6-pyruvoyltetrahydropterin/6-carboxytetrahydropterin synthase